MFIHEMCKLTGLTKKAISYYELQGLLSPETTENGYRNYNDKDAAVLKEIALLRKLGAGISDIKTILESPDKQAALAAYQNKIKRQVQLLDVQNRCISHLAENDYDIDEALDYVTDQLDENRIIKERLVEAFPGHYGQFLSFHFGRYLNEKIDSPEKETAYGKILEFLDGIAELPFLQELKDYMAVNPGIWNDDVMKSIDEGTKAAVDNSEEFIEEKRKIIEMYLAYCKTDAYKTSPAYKMRSQMLEFQKASGYNEVFVENMKVLSRDYAKYLDKLRESNELFLKEYPEAADILGNY